ncbi:MAG: 2-succinyl-5-enolpyruvyl-6-hydroxy-3-cyclohexene-1-carboxylic-acid synthase [Actinomycetota bacterium]|nr:2-succinyl-5-enolpyruvyl-6-hydroxy-3-cyclohexene-1-carboxylic-acid synthase [Actinomycetota bacterium]
MTANDSHLLLRAFCDELARSGVRHACTSPGSRSAPIVLALTREPRIRCWSHIDERCAGFFAVGAAKASGQPLAVTCTSGTAGVNLAPAVIEAHQARVPMIVLTADRPPELRETGAGQTIDQLNLYGSAAKWFFEVGFSEASPVGLRWIRTLACRAYLTAVQGRPGPVHLNFPLREPLVPDGPLGADPVGGRPGGRPWVGSRPGSLRAPAAGSGPIELPERGVVVAGRHERGADLTDAVVRFAERAGYPLVADPLSGARRGSAAIATYDLLLRDPGFTGGRSPELVVRVGDLPTSKPLRAWLAALTDVEQVALDAEGAWQDPASVIGEIEFDEPLAVLRSWTPAAPAAPSGPAVPTGSGWLDAWRGADKAARAAINETLGTDLSEPLVAASLGLWLPPEATVFVASSMPVRDLEEFWPLREDAPRVLCNRGANGIDGTVSSAFGAAAAGDGPVVLLIGDVALLHDLGGLLAARRLGLPMTIVLLNNDGGGIFHFLPVAGEHDVFEEHVATPHGLRFDDAARLYGCGYQRPETISELRAAVLESLGADGTAIIEVRTDRAANRALHRTIEARVRATL